MLQTALPVSRAGEVFSCLSITASVISKSHRECQVALANSVLIPWVLCGNPIRDKKGPRLLKRWTTCGASCFSCCILCDCELNWKFHNLRFCDFWKGYLGFKVTNQCWERDAYPFLRAEDCFFSPVRSCDSQIALFWLWGLYSNGSGIMKLWWISEPRDTST